MRRFIRRRRIFGTFFVLGSLLVAGRMAWSAPHPRVSLNRHLLLDSAQLERLIDDPTSALVVVYDDSNNLWASRLFWTLEYMGHKNAALLDGGLSQWIADSPSSLQSEEAVDPRGRFTVQLQKERLADKDWLLEKLDNPRVKIVDARSPEDYSGADKGAARDREIVAHCQTGIRAAHTYFTLRLLGYEEVRLYDGSWAEWGNSDDTPIE